MPSTPAFTTLARAIATCRSPLGVGNPSPPGRQGLADRLLQPLRGVM
jgi:hypothetical protein